ncbi:patatin-like phospholipase family protein [Aquimarina sp. D1M17]|uniref:patatin-like phospholipase family protein n=1 Tax=Aquimarina acroporae TaxID=2937283 RepID=UPI0020C0E51B|nr:patatin-like phospholipase family protein [Aquimarina acroporae]MCK8522610.1 patatin-like phospholipase family protein [Aquimarina acroporae]
MEFIKALGGKLVEGAIGLYTTGHEIVGKLGTYVDNSVRFFGNLIGPKTNVVIYPTNSKFNFPELTEAGVYNRPNIGLAFSGGGTRSASLSLGYLQAIHKMNLQSKIRYTGSISGGSWAMVPYTYLPKRIKDTDFLGTYTPPENITARSIDTIHARSQIFAHSIANSRLNHRLLEQYSKFFSGADIDETFGNIIGDVFLKKLGLDKNRHTTWKALDITRMTRRNNHLNQHDFYTVEKERPYMCVNGALNQDYVKITNEGILPVIKDNHSAWEHVDFTPKYSGIHRRHRGSFNFTIGGGYLQNIGWDTYRNPVDFKPNDALVETNIENDHRRLSLKDIMGVSGAAPGYISHLVHQYSMNILGGLQIFPKFKTWPVTPFDPALTVDRAFGDGGYTDNYGIIPLLKRRVRSMVIFINTDTPMKKDSRFPFGLSADSFLLQLFGHDVSKITNGEGDITSPSNFLGKRGIGKVFDQRTYKATIQGLHKTHLLSNREYKGSQIPDEVSTENIKDFDLEGITYADKEFLGLIPGVTYHEQEYQVLNNAFYGIRGGFKTRILWVYNDRSKVYENALKTEVKRKLAHNFPFISTFLQNFHSPNFDKRPWDEKVETPQQFFDRIFKEIFKTLDSVEAIDLKNSEVNSLSNIAAWRLLRLQKKVKEVVDTATNVSLQEVTSVIKPRRESLRILKSDVVGQARGKRVRLHNNMSKLRSIGEVTKQIAVRY